MSEPRNDYGFPMLDQKPSQKCVDMVVRYLMGDPSIVLIPKDATRLERAQIIAAGVRARKFPPVTKFTTPKD